MNSLSLFSPSFADEVLNVIDRSFDNNSRGFAPRYRTACHVPGVDVRETDAAYIMEMDLPGYTETDVEISLKDRVLTIASLQKTESAEDAPVPEGEYIIRERKTQPFSRRFTLPDDIAHDDVKAHFEHGVLTVTIPRRPDTQPRQIAITSK